MTAPVFYSPTVLVSGVSVPLAAVSPTQVLTVGGDEGRHALRSMRLQPGEIVDVVDGEGTRVRGVVEPSAAKDNELRLKADECTVEPLRRPQLVLVQALAKGGRDEQAIETATELGVGGVIPWQGDRSVVRWGGDPAKQRKSLERWQRILIAAMKQSRRAWLPELGFPCTSRELAELIEKSVADGDLVMVCHEQASRRLTETLRLALGQIPGQASIRVPKRCLIVVGPEGGVTDKELESFTAAGASAVLLTDSVLRSSTAGPVALTVASLLLGRLDNRVE